MAPCAPGPPIVDMGAYEFRPGDCEHDGDVDLDDYAEFEACITGPGGAATPACLMVDLDGDGDVDVDSGDFATFQITCTGR